MKVTKVLRDLLKRDEVLITLGAHDALSAKIIEKAGIQAIISAGFGISASYLGKPDAELYTMTENLAIVRNMASSVGIPVIADLDTGYGNAVNVIRTVKEFEKAGCAGGVLEDQLAPKRCPACVSAVEIIPLDEAVGKIQAAVDARRGSRFLDCRADRYLGIGGGGPGQRLLRSRSGHGHVHIEGLSFDA